MNDEQFLVVGVKTLSAMIREIGWLRWNIKQLKERVATVECAYQIALGIRAARLAEED